ncbi:MAG TPA: FAD-binding oxidoreductase [Desulfobacteraceae bacterium]|nr:FAD-binding protein [Deltaproteobacteria bacterium]HDI60322.1 FAD-binding oxidoreductase [Desulfobacteraceae bacterium]
MPQALSSAAAAALARRIDGEVAADLTTRTLLATDGSIFQILPAAVVYPRHAGDVQETVRFAAASGLTVHPRGAGSGLCGAALGRGLIIDFTRFMNRLVHLDIAGRTFTCQPGYRLGELEEALAGAGLFFPPDPSSGQYATFGGMYGTNASGSHSVKYGNVADYIVDAELVLADGRRVTMAELARTPTEKLPPPFDRLHRLYTDHAAAIETAYPDTAYNSAGYNLRGLVRDGRLAPGHLLGGSEGTLAVVTQMTFRLLPKPACDSLVVAYMDDIQASARAVQKILPLGPAGIEIMDKSLLALARREDPRLAEALPGDVDNVLLIEFDGPDEENCQASNARVLDVVKGLTDRIHPAASAAEKKRFWAVRKAAVPILYRIKGRRQILALIEDAAVPVRHLGTYFREVYALLERHRVPFVVYGHIAKGLMHTRPLLDLKDPADVAKLRPIADAFYDIVAGLDGTVSGEHGDGRLRSAYIRRRYPTIYDLFLEVKNIFDPHGRLNPEIITHHDPDQMTRDLRYGGEYRRRDTGRTELAWPEGLAPAAELCHGCSKCTTVTGATRMCPVYKATREEAATPKAKANLLRALIGGRSDDQTLSEAAFKAVMSRCVHCGSCLRECPSHVNIPKLAAEAKARYVRRYGNPLHDHLVTRIELAGRATHKVSGLVQALASPAPARRAAEKITGLSARRPMVAFDRRSLFQRLGGTVFGSGPRQILYYAGCDAAYIRPSIGEAAVKLLAAAGWQVLVPPQHCCGLPMLAKGMVDGARRQIRQNLRAWQEWVAGVEAVGVTCSSCGLALMTEWADLMGMDAVGAIAAKVRPVSALVAEAMDRLPLANDTRQSVAYHYPCHLLGQREADSSVRMLSAVKGVDLRVLDSGCCGMAGSWGLHAANDALSRQIARGLMDRIAASGAASAATDCPTCRMQMEQLGPTPVRHPVELVATRLEACSFRRAG